VKKVQFIVYEGNGEVIITTPENEAATLLEYGFASGPLARETNGRDVDDYDRTESYSLALDVRARLVV
jgi:hypothetical protein